MRVMKNQLDALFILNLLHHSTCTCFRHICSPSSGGILYTGYFTTWEHYCRRWFPRSLWSKFHINMCPILDVSGVMTAWNLE